MYTTLISPEDLNENAHRDDWIIFDCRHDLAKPDAGQESYGQGHIPGAFFAHLDRDLSGPKTGLNGRHPLPDAEQFVEFLRRHGVNSQSQIVAYDATGGMYAARLWWMARWIGHEKVAVLDGGLPAWIARGLPLDQIERPGFLGSLKRAAPLADLVTLAQVQANVKSGQKLIIDARAAERYRGDVEPLDARAGHIPGATNRFYQTNLDGQGRFKSSENLRAEFSALIGQRPSSEIVHQCGSGVTACHNLLAMEIARLNGSSLYAGSWSEWSAQHEAPVATGSEP